MAVHLTGCSQGSDLELNQANKTPLGTPKNVTIDYNTRTLH